MPETDITKKPEVMRNADAYNEHTEGDLHANAIRILHTLCKTGICRTSDDNYRGLVRLYRKISDLGELNTPEKVAEAKKYIKLFQFAVNQLEIVDNTKFYRLIGDLVADRGPNCFLPLCFLKKLHDEGVPFRITYSNHDAMFLQAYFDGTLEHNLQDTESAEFAKLGTPPQGRSLLGLQEAIAKGVIDFEAVRNIVETVYLPHLVLYDYSYDANSQKLTIHTHAPSDIQTMQEAARQLGVTFHGREPRQLMQTMNEINERFSVLAKRGLLHYVAGDNTQDKGIQQLIWMRVDNHKGVQGLVSLRGGRDTRGSERNIEFVHGHDLPSGPSPRNVHVIDNDLGKGYLENGASDEAQVATYSAHSTEQAPNPTAGVTSLSEISHIEVPLHDVTRDLLTSRYMAQVRNIRLALRGNPHLTEETKASINESWLKLTNEAAKYRNTSVRSISIGTIDTFVQIHRMHDFFEKISRGDSLSEEERQTYLNKLVDLSLVNQMGGTWHLSDTCPPLFAKYAEMLINPPLAVISPADALKELLDKGLIAAKPVQQRRIQTSSLPDSSIGSITVPETAKIEDIRTILSRIDLSSQQTKVVYSGLQSKLPPLSQAEALKELLARQIITVNDTNISKKIKAGEALEDTELGKITPKNADSRKAARVVLSHATNEAGHKLGGIFTGTASNSQKYRAHMQDERGAPGDDPQLTGGNGNSANQP